VRNSGRRIASLAAFALAVAAAAGCGADRTGGPKGDPTTIVSTSPDRTIAAGTARVDVAIPGATAAGTIDFRDGRADLRVQPPSATAHELRNPLVALDVVRAAVKVTPYGGAEVRGASTIKYELEVAPAEALEAALGGGLTGDTFYADVFIDAQRRIRRVSIPLDLNERRPSRTNRILAKLATIDFHDFAPANEEPT
jgi:hypothetical protein